jgi:hypothetical protein
MLQFLFGHRRFPVGLFAGLTVVVAFAGCSPKDPIGKRVKVEGVVSVDGNPLPNGSLSFRALEDKGNTQKHEPYAIIEADGRYRIYTLGKEGCAPGWYRVVVESTVPLPEGKMGNTESRIDQKYNDAKRSDIDIEVVEKPAPGQYDIKLKK